MRRFAALANARMLAHPSGNDAGKPALRGENADVDPTCCDRCAHCARMLPGAVRAVRAARKRSRRRSPSSPPIPAPTAPQRLIAGAKKEGVVNIYSSVTVDDMKVHRRRLREEIRRQAAGLARQLGEHPAARDGRSPRRPLRGRRDRDQRGRDGIAASRAAAAGGQVAAPRRHRAGGAAPAPANGSATGSTSFPPATTPTWSRRPDCRRPMRTCSIRKWKGKLGIEADDCGLVRRARHRDGRAEGHASSSATSCAPTASRVRKGHTLIANLIVSGEMPFALTVYHYKAEQLKTQRRADRLVRAPARHRALPRHRRDAPRAASARRGPVLRFHAVRRAGAPGRPRLHADQHEGQAARHSLQGHRPRAGARPGRQVAEALRRDRREAGASERVEPGALDRG